MTTICKWCTFICISVLLFGSYAATADLKPFFSDGCSHFPDGTIEYKELWQKCCIEHDRAYWQGGTYEDRLAADKELKECVTKTGEPLIAELMLNGVRVGGTPYLPTKFRWGYGWQYPRGYKKLTEEEKEKIRTTLETQNECVVLLHGLGRTKLSMNKLEGSLKEAGYSTVNLDYPSTTNTIEQIANQNVSDAVKQCQENNPDKIHFVTHSLGGIVVREYLQSNSLPKGSRIVMLAPPNQGSEIVDTLKGPWVSKMIDIPAGQALGTEKASKLNKLKPLNIEIGIITGDKTLNPIWSAVIAGPDDGKVSVERAKLKEMVDFLVVPSTHTFIMRNSAVLQQVAHFLKNGQFDHSEEKSFKENLN